MATQTTSRVRPFAIGAILPDPANLRDRIDLSKVEELADAMREQGYLESRPLEIREVTREDFARQAEKLNQEELAWRSQEMAEFFAGGAAEFVAIAQRGPNHPWAKTRDAFTGSKIYMLLDGEHRLRASRKAGLREVPALVVEVKDDSDLVMRQLAANRSRSASEREFLQGLIRLKRSGVDRERAKKAIGKNETWFAARWQMIDVIPDRVLEEVSRKLAVTEAQELHKLYSFVGRSDLTPNKDAVDRIVLDIFEDWRAELERIGSKPIGYIQNRVQSWEKDLGGQKFLLTPDLPSGSSIASKGLGRDLSRYREVVSTLAGKLNQAWITWQIDHPGAELDAFVREAVSRDASISQVLRELKIGHDQLELFVCRLCADGREDEACTICEQHHTNNLMDEFQEFSMAKKKTSRKKTAKKSTRKKAAKKTVRKKVARKKTTRKKTAKKKPVRKAKNRRPARKKVARKKVTRKKAAKRPARKATAKKKTVRKAKNRRAPQSQVKLGAIAKRAGALVRYRIQDGQGNVKFVANKGHLVVSGRSLLIVPASRVTSSSVDIPGNSKTLKGPKAGRLLSVEYRWQGKSYVHEFKDTINLVRVGSGVLAASGVRYTKASGFLN